MQPNRSAPDPAQSQRPLPHPLVRAARRAAELVAIEAWCARHSVTVYAPAFVALCPQAARDPVPAPATDQPIVTDLAACLAWLIGRGVPVMLEPEGRYRLGDRLISERHLVAHAVRLQAREQSRRVAARMTLLAILTDCARRGRRCPPDRVLHRMLHARGLSVPRDDGIVVLFARLVAEGHIAMRIGAGNARVVTVLEGPHAGCATAIPPARPDAQEMAA
jgi:hypothetical protein